MFVIDLISSRLLYDENWKNIKKSKKKNHTKTHRPHGKKTVYPGNSILQQPEKEDKKREKKSEITGNEKNQKPKQTHECVWLNLFFFCNFF